MKTLLHAEDGFNILFIRRELDDYILLANEFRVYSHLARRAGAQGAFPAVESMARICRLHQDTVRRCLGHLLKLNLVRARTRKGCTTVYTLTELSDWKPAPQEGKQSENSPASESTQSPKPRSSRRKGRRDGGRTDGKTLLHGETGFNILFIRAELDDYILTANEFRIYAHLARRAGGDWGWPSVGSMARQCRMHADTVGSCLRRLKELNLVRAHARQGRTTLYTLTPFSAWKPAPRRATPPESKGAPLVSEGTPPKRREGTPPKARETKCIQEGYPLKDNTVAAPSEAPESTPPIPNAPPVPPSLPPGGSVTASHHAALSENPSKHRKQECRPRQTPLQRKAYAIATRLQGLHWDNCKIRYSLHPSRAYAERALREGHDEGRISAAYRASLNSCHGFATDEINRGERHQHEKATCALTVTLAADSLSLDGKTASERWPKVIERLQEECRRQQIEETQIVQQIAQASPAIAAWFARNGNAMGAHPNEGRDSHASDTQPEANAA